jgi:LPS-assembly protein
MTGSLKINFFTVIIICFYTSISAETTPAISKLKAKIQKKPTANLLESDWLPIQRPFSPCTGYYLQKELPKTTQAEISADSSELAKNGVSRLTGNVVYLDKDQKISAEHALAYRDDKLKKVTEILVYDNVEYLAPNLRVITSQARANLLTNTANLDSNIYYRYYSNNARGEAERAVLVKDKSYNIFNASYTTCEPNSSDWQIYATDISIDPNSQIGTAKNTVIYFYDFPIFYSPYLSFPTSKQRKSGLLLPLYNSSDRYGYSIAQPYYLNLAPNYDATITPRYMTKRGSQLQLETRYLDSWGKSIVNFEILPDDRDFATFRHNKLLNPPSGIALNDPRITNLKSAKPQRFAIKIKDNKQLTPNLSSRIEFNYFSDNQYIIDLPPSEVLRKQPDDHVLQQLKVNYNYNNWQSSGLIKGYQTLHTIDGPKLTEPYRILPGITLSNNNFAEYNFSDSLNFPMGLNLGMDSHAMYFARPLHPNPDKSFDGQRYYIKPTASLPVKQSYGYITPKIAVNARYYSLNQLTDSAKLRGYNKSQDYVIPIYSVDSGLFFDRKFEFNNTNYNQTLEPRLFYLYVPSKNQYHAPNFDIKTNTLTYSQLFRDNYFSGFDRQSNANQIAAGLGSRVQNLTNGAQYLYVQFGQAFYFQEKNITICDPKFTPNCIKNEIPDYKKIVSPFIAELNINFEPKFYGQAEWQWDHYLQKTGKINVGLHYLDQEVINKSPQTLVNIEYNFLKEGNIQNSVNGTRIYKPNDRKNDLSEIEGSLKLPIHNNWNLLSFSSYDLQSKSALDNYVGLELQKCCWAVRFGYRNQLRLRTNSTAQKKYDNMYSIQFSLKGLGELHESFENILRTNIPGYYNHLNTIY